VVDRKRGDVRVIDRQEAVNQCIVSDTAERSIHGRPLVLIAVARWQVAGGISRENGQLSADLYSTF
jgi:hypothetical protein